MKILILAVKAVLGGHILSALTIARYMKRRGHEIIFAAGSGPMVSVIEQEMPFIEVNIPFLHGSQYTYFTWKSFPIIRQLKSIIAREQIEMIHVFDARSYIPAHIAGLLSDTPVTCTICGGIDPHYNIPLIPKLMVFSEEQKDKMVKGYGWSSDNVEVIRTRLDIDQILSDQEELPHKVVTKLNSHLPTIMMISSFDSTKIHSIHSVLDALTIVLEKGRKVQMVFIGGQGPLFEETRAKAEKLNTQMGVKLLYFTGPVLNAYRLLAYADIVLGVGRSAFEGMTYAKPTVIIGANGFAGVVSRESIQDIAYYNFSGRNQQEHCLPEILANEIEKLLSDRELQKKLGEFGKKFVMEEIDVKRGLQRIEEVYQINMSKRTLLFKILQWLSVFKIMIPIWLDNFHYTLSRPVKKLLELVGLRTIRKGEV